LSVDIEFDYSTKDIFDDKLVEQEQQQLEVVSNLLELPKPTFSTEPIVRPKRTIQWPRYLTRDYELTDL